MVSVIIPTYNREKTILRSAESVLKQTYGDLELIIVDDCSTDDTERVVASLDDKRVRYIKLEKNSGACVARNAGIEAATGEYIAFQDSDDEWHPDKLEKQLKVMEDTGADVSFHRVVRIFPGSDKTKLFPDMDESRFMSHREMCNRAIITTQTIMGKRKVFERYRFDPRVKKTQDYDWGIRASRDHSFYYISEVMVKQFVQEDSISNKGKQLIIDTRRYFLKKYRSEFDFNPDFEIFQLDTIGRCKEYLGQNAYREFLRMFRIKKTPYNLGMALLSGSRLMGLGYRLKRRIKERKEG